MKKQTAGQLWLAKRMKSPTFAAEFKKAREEVDAVDALVRSLDERRISLGMTKQELARRVGQNPSSLRRLLTLGGNPSLQTIMEIADAVGMVVKLDLPQKEPATTSSTRSRSTTSTRKLEASA